MNIEVIKKLNGGVDGLISTLEINEDCAVNSIWITDQERDQVKELVKELRKAIKEERPDYKSPYEDILAE